VRRVRRMRQQQCLRSVGSHSVLERLQEGGSSAAVPVYAGVEATGTPPPQLPEAAPPIAEAAAEAANEVAAGLQSRRRGPR